MILEKLGGFDSLWSDSQRSLSLYRLVLVCKSKFRNLGFFPFHIQICDARAVTQNGGSKMKWR